MRIIFPDFFQTSSGRKRDPACVEALVALSLKEHFPQSLANGKRGRKGREERERESLCSLRSHCFQGTFSLNELEETPLIFPPPPSSSLPIFSLEPGQGF